LKRDIVSQHAQKAAPLKSHLFVTSITRRETRLAGRRHCLAHRPARRPPPRPPASSARSPDCLLPQPQPQPQHCLSVVCGLCGGAACWCWRWPAPPVHQPRSALPCCACAVGNAQRVTATANSRRGGAFRNFPAPPPPFFFSKRRLGVCGCVDLTTCVTTNQGGHNSSSGRVVLHVVGLLRPSGPAS
jgi:hypothetical protein